MTAPTLSPQLTSPATLSTLPLATIRDIVATLQAAFPAEHARIARGVQVLLTSQIVETPTLGRYLVQSTQDGVLYYEATSWNCSCPDRQRHADEGRELGLRCKHSWALDILSVASAIASRQRAEAAQAASAGRGAGCRRAGPRPRCAHPLRAHRAGAHGPRSDRAPVRVLLPPHRGLHLLP